MNFQYLNRNLIRLTTQQTEQKSQTDAINLTDDILDEHNLFRNTNTEDIWIEDDLFDDYDTQAIKNILKEIIDAVKPDGTVFDDIDFEPIEANTIPDDIETINIKVDIDILSDEGIAIDAPKKVKILTEPNRLRITSNEIKKKYIHQKSKGILKKANKKEADCLRRVGYIDIDDLETNDYNNDTNNALKDTTADNIDNINLKKTSGAQIDAKNKLLKNTEI